MADKSRPGDLSFGQLLQGGLLTRAVRRDLTDLNRQFLELGLNMELVADPRFAWSEDVRAGLLKTDGATRDRMAACPFALFEIMLPPGRADAGAASPRVEDALRLPAIDEPWRGRCLAFVHFALFVAWRLADTAPLATRVALGLSPEMELQLNEMCPSDVAGLAAHGNLIRPRWPGHSRFWAMLRGAAAEGSSVALQWAHCVGICLLGVDLNRIPAASAAPAVPRHRPPG